VQKIYFTEEEKRQAQRENAKRYRRRRAGVGHRLTEREVRHSSGTDSRAQYWQDLLGELERNKLLAIVLRDIAAKTYLEN
jgi:hypothetical protein